MKTQITVQISPRFKPGARPPQKLTPAAKKLLDEAVPSLKAHELAERSAKANVVIRP